MSYSRLPTAPPASEPISISGLRRECHKHRTLGSHSCFSKPPVPKTGSRFTPARQSSDLTALHQVAFVTLCTGGHGAGIVQVQRDAEREKAMDFVQWCGIFLSKLLELQEASATASSMGVRFDQLERALSGEQPSRPRSQAVSRAFEELKRVGILEQDRRLPQYLKIPRPNRELALNHTDSGCRLPQWHNA